VNEDQVANKLTYVAVDETSNEVLGFYLLREPENATRNLTCSSWHRSTLVKASDERSF